MGVIGLAGAGLTLVGLAGVGYSIGRLFAIRRAGLADTAARQAMQRLLPVNLLALLVAVIGLMLMIVDLVV